MSTLRSLVRSFRFAGRGIAAGFMRERNLRIHGCAAVFVVLAGIWQKLSAAAWAVELLCCALVIALELVNSAIERSVESPDPAHWRAAGGAKDMAAGAVLAFSIASAAVGVMLFWQPEVLCAIPGWFFAHPWALALLAASLAGAWFFVFWPERKKG